MSCADKLTSFVGCIWHERGHHINQRLAVSSMRLSSLKEGPPASAAEFMQEIGEVWQEIADLAAHIQA